MRSCQSKRNVTASAINEVSAALSATTNEEIPVVMAVVTASVMMKLRSISMIVERPAAMRRGESGAPCDT